MNWLLVGIILTSFITLGSSRVGMRIKAVAAQGAILSIIQFMARGSLFDIHSVLLFTITIAIKTIGIPLLILRAIKGMPTRAEKEPTISNHFLFLAVTAITIICFMNVNILPLRQGSTLSPLFMPVAMATVLAGFLVLVTKSKAANQIIGFLVLENGVFTFGMTIVSDFPAMVEIGVLLDLLVGVFIMGIMLYQINKTFDHIDTRALSALGDHE